MTCLLALALALCPALGVKALHAAEETAAPAVEHAAATVDRAAAVASEAAAEHAAQTHEAMAGAHEAAAEGGHHERDMTQPVVSEMIWSIVVFAVFFGLLSVLVWPKILKGLKAREQKIADDLAKTEKAAHAAQATLQEYQAQLAQARAQAADLLEQTRQEAEQLGLQLKEQTQNEIAAAKTRAQAEIKYAKDLAVADLYRQAAELSAAIAGKILQREINPADQDRLVQESLAVMKKEDLN